MRALPILAGLLGATAAWGQIPDLLNALDAGGRSMGIGGGLYVTESSPLSGYYNPAGLAFIRKPTVSFVFRTMPESFNVVSGRFADPISDTSNFVGSRRGSHLGFVAPLKDKAALGISYTIGGYIRDTRVGNNLSSPSGISIRNYRELLQAQTDFFNVSYGAQGRGGLNWGVGVLLANQYIRNDQSYSQFDGSNNNIGTVNTELSGNASGVGGIAGVQYTPPANPNLSLGLSVRTPVDLGNNSETQSYLDRIPGRISAGFAARADGGGRDFVVYGLQADYYFGGQRDKIIDRDDTFAVGGGVEYNLHRFGARWPIRLGFNAIPAGGDGFDERNAFTFGFGYRPLDGDFSIDLNFAAPGSGRYDMALGVTYRFGN